MAMAALFSRVVIGTFLMKSFSTNNSQTYQLSQLSSKGPFIVYGRGPEILIEPLKMPNKGHFYLTFLVSGGAGGKGTWGAPGSEISETGETVDQGDPNYDSDSQEDYKLKVVTPALSDEELKKALEPVLQEYLMNGDTDEVAVNTLKCFYSLSKKSCSCT